MKTFIAPPDKIPFLLRIMVWIADKKAGKKMLPGRILSWSWRISVGSAILELFIEGGAAKILDKRLIKLLRMYISFTVPSAFAIDINSWNYKNFDITEKEIKALQGLSKLDSVKSFSQKEIFALKYAFSITKTPVFFEKELSDKLKILFSSREILAIATLSAKVNYWARLIESLGISPAGYTEDEILHLEKYSTSTPQNS